MYNFLAGYKSQPTFLTLQMLLVFRKSSSGLVQIITKKALRCTGLFSYSKTRDNFEKTVFRLESLFIFLESVEKYRQHKSEMSSHFLYDSDLAGNIQSVVIWCKPYISLLLSIRPVKKYDISLKNYRSYLLEKMF